MRKAPAAGSGEVAGRALREGANIAVYLQRKSGDFLVEESTKSREIPGAHTPSARLVNELKDQWIDLRFDLEGRPYEISSHRVPEIESRSAGRHRVRDSHPPGP
jgi:hypothetical protein